MMTHLRRQNAVGEVPGNIPFRPRQGDLVDPGVQPLEFVVVHHGRHGLLAFYAGLALLGGWLDFEARDVAPM